ncbi:putative resolvase [Actinopolymorpha pittospori]|uniref:Resolvase n=1 Tax=Actinopolymorpha pittospori TaxID=648752 RepID=A0A927RM13_9ACTN|nr:putative resolvase [Actinopolymorpha pittospori]
MVLCVNLTGWACAQGVAPRTAYRWFREGTLPVPAEGVGPRTILVNIDANTSPSVAGGVGLYARVCSHEQRSDLDRQTARLSAWAAKAEHKVVRVESEIGSGMNGCRPKAKRQRPCPRRAVVSSSSMTARSKRTWCLEAAADE